MAKCNGLLSAAFGALVPFAAVAASTAPEGSCDKKASEIRTIDDTERILDVNFIHEWTYDEDEYGTASNYKEQTNYVHCYKVSLSYDKKKKKGIAYSLWLTDDKGETVTDANIAIDDIQPAEPTTDDGIPPFANFDEYSGGWGLMQVLKEEEWTVDEPDPEDNDPSPWWYHIRIIGVKDANVKLHYQRGNRLPLGIADNPQTLTFGESEQKTSLTNFVKGETSYYFQGDLEQDRRYIFATVGGTVENAYSLDFDDGDRIVYDDWIAVSNASVALTTEGAGPYTICVSETATNRPSATFQLRYKVLPTRSIGEHEWTELKLDEEQRFVPGRLSGTGFAYYDGIIDQKLFRFEGEKGKVYSVDTFGAETNLLMRLYDANGARFKQSRIKGDGSHDVRCCFTCESNGVYYVGVCQDMEDDVHDTPLGKEISLKLQTVESKDGEPDRWDAADDVWTGATYLTPMPYLVDGTNTVCDDVRDGDLDGSEGWHQLGRTDWTDVFAIAVRKGMTYALTISFENPDLQQTTVKSSVFRMDGKSERSVRTKGNINYEFTEPLRFTADDNGTYYLRLSVIQGEGLDFPKYKIHAIGCDEESKSADNLGVLRVSLYGALSATWSFNGEKTRYASGAAILVPEPKSGKTYRVKYGSVNGFATPVADTDVVVEAGEITDIEKWYTDKYDPKDDEPSGAAKWSLGNKAKTEDRTLWSEDPADNFAFSSKDGYYYDIWISAQKGFAKDSGESEVIPDAVFSISNADTGDDVVKNVTRVEKRLLPKAKYIVTVVHSNAVPQDTSYQLSGFYANVGTVGFAKNAVAVKDSATAVALKVNRTAKDGMVRVRYHTVDGSAKSNEQYVAQSGVLEWADGDKAAKTVTIKLIPKLLALTTGDFDFKVVIEDAEGDYPAALTADTCAVTIQNAGKYASAADAYAAANKTKTATTNDETVSLRGGTYYGVVQTLFTTNGLPALASVTLTVGAKEAGDPSKDTISAKVMLAGKTYTFKTAKGEPAWDEGEPGAGGVFKKKLVLMQRLGSSVVSNVLSVTVHDGVPGDWTQAVKEDVSLTMNVPDAKGKGYQADVKYAGGICRQNAKIQGYLDAAYKFAGYYTVALVPGDAVLTSGTAPDEGSGLPSGSGYLTVTVDNKGKAKVAGLLADGTKVSASPAACGIVGDVDSVLGYSMLVPVYLAKSPFCFGGWLKLAARADSGRPDGRNCKVVVDGLESELFWNNDNAALTHDGKEGWRMTIQPVGGWYDKVFNLQAYYNDWAQQFEIDTILRYGFPKEELPAGYVYATSPKAQVDGTSVELAGNALELPKKSLVKVGKTVDFDLSVNPCDVKVKFVRATGLVSGSLSLWAETEDGLSQKEVKGYKYNGVITLDRDDGSEDVLADETVSAGFISKSIKIGKRKWAFSVPFMIMGRPRGNLGNE